MSSTLDQRGTGEAGPSQDEATVAQDREPELSRWVPGRIERLLKEMKAVGRDRVIQGRALSDIDDGAKRRATLTQLNRGEGRHSVGRAVFHGRRGELRQHYHEGQEDQLGALGLVLNMIVLWNTIYMESIKKAGDRLSSGLQNQ